MSGTGAVVLKVGEKISLSTVTTTSGERVVFEGGRTGGKIHLQLRCFANPSNRSIFSSTLKSYASRMGEIVPAKVKPVIVFSLDESIMKDQMGYFEWTIGLSLVADPLQVIFRTCGSEKASTTMTVGTGIVRDRKGSTGSSSSLFKMFKGSSGKIDSASGGDSKGSSISIAIEGSAENLAKSSPSLNKSVAVKETTPMDILVDAKTGIILAIKQGTHPEDHWTVTELLNIIKSL